MKFQTFGPFSVPLSVEEKMEILCPAFDRAKQGLKDASGVYIFAKKLDEKLIPIYVGQTQKNTFGGRIPAHFNEPSNSRLAACWDDTSLEISLFLIALLKGDGQFRNIKIDKENHFRSIRRLEDVLIGSCLEVNSDLFNIKSMGWHRDIHVPGYLNSKPGDEDYTDASGFLATMLQKKK